MHIRQAGAQDLGAINEVIRAAVMSWDLPERVKRLSMDSYCYHELDLRHFHFLVAESGEQLLGIAAIDDDIISINEQSSLTLHGLYVRPDYHRRGIGAQLFAASEDYAKRAGTQGLLVKAQKDAVNFFEKQGMQKLTVHDQDRDYANRYWKRL